MLYTRTGMEKITLQRSSTSNWTRNRAMENANTDDDLMIWSAAKITLKATEVERKHLQGPLFLHMQKASKWKKAKKDVPTE